MADVSTSFIGRDSELEVLRQAFKSRRSAFIPIYGRRRVGKSELIVHFLKAHRGFYFVGKQASRELQMREFLQEASIAAQEPLLAALPCTDWKTTLQNTVERLTAKGKVTIAFDEFQWTVESSPELPSVLQELWDRSWSKDGKVLLILCGSYVGFMEREILGRKSPLFGRRDAQIQLQPFNFREAARFHPNYSRVDQARTWFVCGGVPFYLRQFSDARSVESNIVTSLLEEFGTLHREPDFLLREELRDVERYYAILMAVALGSLSLGDIAQKAGVDEKSLGYYLKQLIELGYLERCHPLTDRPPNVRQVRYLLQDPLLRLWFRFVYPNTSFLRMAGPQRTLRERVVPQLPAYFGDGFERMCRAALPLIYRREGLSAGFEVGSYWDKTTQVDVVGLREDGWTDLGECKWGTVPSSRQLVAQLDARVARYPNSRNATIGRRFFVRSGIPRQADRATWHDLEDLYTE